MQTEPIEVEYFESDRTKIDIESPCMTRSRRHKGRKSTVKMKKSDNENMKFETEHREPEHCTNMTIPTCKLAPLPTGYLPTLPTSDSSMV